MPEKDDQRQWYERFSGILGSAFRAVASGTNGFQRPEAWEIFDAPPTGTLSGSRSDVFLALSPNGPDSTAVRGFIESSPELSAIKTISNPEDLATLNASVNRRLHYSDTPDVGDRFQPPSEMIDRQRGDCEDFAITKYHLLRALGVPETDMALLIYHGNKEDASGHVALAIRLNKRTFVMDNNPDGEIFSLAFHRDMMDAEYDMTLYSSQRPDHAVRLISGDSASYIQQPPRPLPLDASIQQPRSP